MADGAADDTPNPWGAVVATLKRPAFQFYPADWRKDLALRTCSIGARGLWVELMATMHEGTPYGHLALDGEPLSDEEAASLAGIAVKEYTRLLAELERRKVFSRNEAGVIYSRRMVRDEDVRNKRALGGDGGKEYGAKGAAYGAKGGRPTKQKGGKGTPLKTPLPPEAEPPSEPPPSSSSSSSATPTPNSAVAELPPLAGAAAAAVATAALAPRLAALGFTDPRHIDAALGYLRSSAFPDAVIAHWEGLREGLGAPGGAAVEAATLGQALHEMRVASVLQHSSKVLAKFLAGVGDGPAHASASEADAEAAFFRRVRAGDFLPPELREAAHE